MGKDVQAWVGCLGCYNAGQLVGAWVDGLDAARYQPCNRPDHDEAWVLDHELPRGLLDGECSPAQFAELCEALDLLPAGVTVEVAAAVADALGYSGDVVAIGELARTWHDLVDGPYDSLMDAAYEYVESIGGPEHLPTGVLARYFDWQAFGRDLGLESSAVAELPSGAILLLR